MPENSICRFLCRIRKSTFGGDFETETDYRDPFILEKLQEPGNFVLFPLNKNSYNTINQEIIGPVPSPPTMDKFFGTDDRGRDVLARLIYGFRLSILFGLALTFTGTLVGIVAGAVQGYFGGRTDLLMQRFIEIWGAMPELYLLIIFASIFKPSILLLLILLSLFSWMGLSDYVRAEFLRGRNLEYVNAARALGVGNVDHNVATPPAQWHNAGHHLSSFSGFRGDSGSDQSRFSWPWRAAIDPKSGRIARPGQGEYRGVVALLIRFCCACRYVDPAHFYR